MTVQELVDQLNNLVGAAGKNTMVIMAKDEEGNNFSPLSEMSVEMYLAETPWSGEVVWDPDDNQAYPPEAVQTICLWPRN